MIDAGLTWVGPPPESIEQMGSKVAAKELMAAAGVPVLPSCRPEPTSPRPTCPLLVKASAGGGGRGMRIVRDLGRAAPRGRAGRPPRRPSAFGDATVFCEPYVERGRHVEVQVLGDTHGTRRWSLGERDCSVQRRHQKVVEEAPRPGLADGDARRAARRGPGAPAEAIGYVGAGTVEFLLDARTGGSSSWR